MTSQSYSDYSDSQHSCVCILFLVSMIGARRNGLMNGKLLAKDDTRKAGAHTPHGMSLIEVHGHLQKARFLSNVSKCTMHRSGINVSRARFFPQISSFHVITQFVRGVYLEHTFLELSFNLIDFRFKIRLPHEWKHTEIEVIKYYLTTLPPYFA